MAPLDFDSITETASALPPAAEVGRWANTGIVNVKDPPYNATGLGVADDTTAIQAAITSLGANGGTVLFPPGTYKYSSLTAASTRSVTLLGLASTTAGAAPASVLACSTAGAGTGIDATNSYGFTMRGLGLTATSLTGSVLNLRGTSTAFSLVEDCTFSGAGAAMARIGGNALEGTFRRCNFLSQTTAITGLESVGDSSNIWLFDQCQFTASTVAAVRTAGNNWTFLNCTFEPLANGNGIAYLNNDAIDGLAQNNTGPLAFIGCWFGDASAAATAWIKYRGEALTVLNCKFQMPNGATGISLLGGDGTFISGNGHYIAGNNFSSTGTTPTTYGIKTDAGTFHNVAILGNHFGAGTVAVSNPMSYNGSALGPELIWFNNGALLLPTAVAQEVLFAARLLISSATGNAVFTAGGNSPEGVVTAGPGSYYADSTNGEGYIKKTGTGNTGWKLVTHA